MKQIALDIETVANQPDYFKSGKKNDLISIALVNIDNTNEVFYATVRPPIEYQGGGWYKNHGMTWETQKDEKTLDQIWPEILDFMEDSHIYAHNAFGFDMKVLIESAEHYGLELPECTWIDTKHEWMIRGKNRSESSLENLSRSFGFYDSGHHNALVDTKMLVKLIHEMRELNFFKDGTKMVEMKNVVYKTYSKTSDKAMKSYVEFTGMDFLLEE